MADCTVCPRCGLPLADRSVPPEQPTCNPIRSPDCWSFVATLPKAGSVEAAVVRGATRNEG